MVELSYWAYDTYPDTRGTMTELDQTGIDYLNSVKGTNMYKMFYGCGSISRLDTSKWDTSNVIDMNAMFKNCRSLNSLDLSNWNTSNVTTMSKMFFYCVLLKYLIIGSRTFKFQMKDSNCGNLIAACKILVPSSLISTYQNATNWSSRASQFDAIENYTVTRSNGQVTVTPK